MDKIIVADAIIIAGALGMSTTMVMISTDTVNISEMIFLNLKRNID